MMQLGPFGIIVHLHHEAHHQPRQRQPIPPEVRRYIYPKALQTDIE